MQKKTKVLEQKILQLQDKIFTETLLLNEAKEQLELLRSLKNANRNF